jgi:hypothetical protein
MAQNSLGLELDKTETAANVTESPAAEVVPVENSKGGDDQEKSPQVQAGTPVKEKKVPYINPERVKTGGQQRVSSIKIDHFSCFSCN